MNPNDSLIPASSRRRLHAGLIGGLCSLFLVLLAGQAWATPCDLDQDGDVDVDDITQLQRSLPGRPKVSGPDDPRDPDRNRRIDIGDVRACVLRCTLPRCACVSPAPPTVSLTAPVADARYLAPATITLAADASGATPVTRVEFLADATVIATVGNTPYTAEWPNVAAGTYQLSARATDRGGAATTSGARRILVDSHNTPPTVSLNAPLDGAAYPLSATVTLTATASDVELNTPVSRVDFYHGSTLIGGSTTVPYQLDWTPPAAGVYRLTARATDSAGATTTSAAHDLTVQGNLPPTVSLTSPRANERFTAPATVTLTANANDTDGVVRVDFFHGATLIGSAASSPYRVVWNPVAAGSYLLTAQATDRLGASQTSAVVPITVNAAASAGLTVLYLHADHLGTPRVATDESQTVVWRNPPTSEPFGMALPEEDPDGDGRLTTINLRFPGQYFDQETQAHYNYFRDHYFPELGRYGQSDPIGLRGGPNLYAYANNAPTMFVDHTGLMGQGSGAGRGNPTWGKGGPSAPCPCPTPPVSPSSGSCSANITEAQRSYNLLWLYDQVRNRGPWDYKQQGSRYQNFGNFNYGATGAAFGFSSQVLYRAAGWAQQQAGTSQPQWGSWYESSPYGDDPDDQYWIQQGIQYYRCGCYKKP
jgi:RHS repeat-associated protein